MLDLSRLLTPDELRLFARLKNLLDAGNSTTLGHILGLSEVEVRVDVRVVRRLMPDDTMIQRTATRLSVPEATVSERLWQYGVAELAVSRSIRELKEGGLTVTDARVGWLRRETRRIQLTRVGKHPAELSNDSALWTQLHGAVGPFIWVAITQATLKTLHQANDDPRANIDDQAIHRLVFRCVWLGVEYAKSFVQSGQRVDA